MIKRNYSCVKSTRSIMIIVIKLDLCDLDLLDINDAVLSVKCNKLIISWYIRISLLLPDFCFD